MTQAAPVRRPPLPPGPFEVVIIGGGINGVAVARECALGGKRVLLLEQNDFGSGTSSRSSRIIHGGLRYMEHGELGLVRESLKQRECLLRERPHLVRSTTFLLALEESERSLSLRNPLAIRAGLGIYRLIAGARPQSWKDEVKELQASLDHGRSWHIFHYEDAQCPFPERLIAEWLVEASAAGAVCRNHVSVLAVERESGRVAAVRVRDQLSGEEFRVAAQHVINATGPWADRLCEASNIASQRMIGGVRGSHILLPRFAGAPMVPLYTEAEDRRPFFVIPWNGEILVGTTEVADDGDPNQVRCDEREMQYLLRSVMRLFPQSGIRTCDVRAVFAGVRPLPFAPGRPMSEISRRHSFRDHREDGAEGMLSIIGGKLTTAATVARECAALLGISATQESAKVIARGRRSGFESALRQWSSQVAREYAGVGISESVALAIAEWHGAASPCVIRKAAESAEMGERLCPHSNHIVAEADVAVRQEHAVTLADILLRRVPVALGPCWSDDCARYAAARIGAVLGWNEQQQVLELEDFARERAAFLQDPKTVSTEGSMRVPEHVA